MNKWAVIKTGGKQYKVSEGETVAIEKLQASDGDKASINEVFLIAGEKIVIGTPQIANAKVTGKIASHFKDQKVRVVKFKSKSRYSRTYGHRQAKVNFLVEKITP